MSGPSTSAFLDPGPSGPNRPRAIPRRAVLAVGLLAPLIVLAYGTISLLAAHSLTSPHFVPHVLAPQVLGSNPERWSVRTDDGLTLRGWYAKAEGTGDSSPTPNAPAGRSLVILVHGLWRNWDEVAGPARGLHARGHDVLVFDLRGHGDSDPDRVTMGRRERLDIRAALGWAIEQGYTPNQIAWLGYSLGGSTILMEAADNPSIHRAIVDSPFGDLPAVLSAQLALHSGLPAAFNPGILGAAHWAFGTRTDDLIPVRSARRWGDRPLLVIHGTADATVPFDQAQAIAAAAGPSCQLVLVPGVDHVHAFPADPGGYVERIDRFLRGEPITPTGH